MNLKLFKKLCCCCNRKTQNSIEIDSRYSDTSSSSHHTIEPEQHSSNESFTNSSISSDFLVVSEVKEIY